MTNCKKIKLGKCNNIYMHKSSKFKSIGISIIYKMKYDYKLVSAFNILAKYLGNCSLKFPSIESFNKNIDDLYGSTVGIKCDYIGSLFTICFYVDFINPKYINDDNLYENAIKLLHDMIYEPLIIDGKLDEEIFEVCKENCLIDVRSIKEYNMGYVISKLKETISQDKKSALATNTYGSKKILSKLNNTNIVKYYNKMLTAPFDICVTGEYKYGKIKQLLRKYFNKKGIRNISYNPLGLIEDKEYEPIIIKKKVSQSKVAIAYRIPILFNDPLVYAFSIARYIFSGTLSSKFYKVIREEKGLCYSINSRYSKYYGTFIVTTGVDGKNVNTIIDEVNKQIEEVKNGNVSDDEFLKAKEMVINSFLTIDDSFYGIINMTMAFNSFSMEFSFKEELEKYKNVTKEDVINAVKMMTYCTYCVLLGEKYEKESL